MAPSDWLAFLVWIALRGLLLDGFVIHENVAGFPVGLLIELLGDIYDVQTSLVDAAELGASNDRVRRITILRCKNSSCPAGYDWPSFVNLFKRKT